MTSIINIPYLTSGRQLRNEEDKSKKNADNNEKNEYQINEDKIIKRRREYLKLSGAFKDAYNYRTFKSASS